MPLNHSSVFSDQEPQGVFGQQEAVEGLVCGMQP